MQISTTGFDDKNTELKKPQNIKMQQMYMMKMNLRQ